MGNGFGCLHSWTVGEIDAHSEKALGAQQLFKSHCIAYTSDKGGSCDGRKEQFQKQRPAASCNQSNLQLVIGRGGGGVAQTSPPHQHALLYTVSSVKVKIIVAAAPRAVQAFAPKNVQCAALWHASN